MPARRLYPTLALFLLLSLPVLAVAATGRIDLLGEGARRGVEITKITADEIRFRDADGTEHTAALDDLVGVGFPEPPGAEPEPGPADVEVLLRGGDRVRGELVPGEPDQVTIESPLLGRLSWLVDFVKEIRFLGAWSAAADKPAFPPGGSPVDLFFFRSLDHVEGTWTKATDDQVVVRPTAGGERSLAFDDLLAIRFAEGPEPPAPEGRVAIVLLTDGSRVTASRATSDGRELRLTTPAGRDLRVPLSAVLSLHMKGGRFLYLSDLEPKAVKIVPWLGETYAWDRPRFDESFLDLPIRAGGETWRKGIGVISGTSLTFAVPAGVATFTSRIALDDAAGEEGDVVFEVLVDGESRFQSDPIRRSAPGAAPAAVPPIDVSGASTITLRVGFVDDFVNDFADWIEPMLIRGK